MFGSANVARHGLLEQVLWQCCGSSVGEQCGIEPAVIPPHSLGLAIKSSSSTFSSLCCRPSTNRLYSSSSLDASFSLILVVVIFGVSMDEDRREVGKATRTHSAIFSVKVSTLRAAVSSIGRVKSIERDSMQTLSGGRFVRGQG